MLVRTDDEIYRVDSVWLGPPRATFPWRARYVSYGVGLLVMIAIMFAQRRVGIGLEFFSVAWALVITVLTTRFIGQRIDYERQLCEVLVKSRQFESGECPAVAVDAASAARDIASPACSLAALVGAAGQR